PYRSRGITDLRRRPAAKLPDLRHDRFLAHDACHLPSHRHGLLYDDHHDDPAPDHDVHELHHDRAPDDNLHDDVHVDHHDDAAQHHHDDVHVDHHDDAAQHHHDDLDEHHDDDRSAGHHHDHDPAPPPQHDLG